MQRYKIQPADRLGRDKNLTGLSLIQIPGAFRTAYLPLCPRVLYFSPPLIARPERRNIHATSFCRSLENIQQI